MDLVRLFIDKGADKLKSGLLKASEGGHTSVVLFLIEKAGYGLKSGRDVLNKGMHAACKRSHIKLASLLIHKGAMYCDHALRYAGVREPVDLSKRFYPSLFVNDCPVCRTSGISDRHDTMYGFPWS